MAKRRIFCDLDMTLCDTIHPVREMIREKHGIDYKISDFTSYGFLEEQLGPEARNFWAKEGLYDKVPLYPYAQWFIENLKQLGDLNICTYSIGENVMQWKDDFIGRKFNIDPLKIIHAREKHQFLEKEDILIDDYLVNIQGHHYHNQGTSILFNHNDENPWAKYHPATKLTDKLLYANNYLDVLNKVKELMRETV